MNPKLTVAAASAITLVLGSIHAFSVFVPQWEAATSAGRAEVSLVYSLALVSLTIAVLFGYKLYSRLSPAAMVCISGVISALGLFGASQPHSIIGLYLFYSLLFGAGNGLGYGYALQLAGQAMPQSRGRAMGIVTAFYAVGATLAPMLFLSLINASGNGLALSVAALVILGVCLLAALTLSLSRANFSGESAETIVALTASLQRARMLMWVSYGTGVIAGLMIIGHAYAIARWLDLSPFAVSAAPVVVAIGNMAGGFAAGFLADKFQSSAVLQWLPVGSIAGLLLLGLSVGELSGLAGLAIVGFSYGALIAVYPVAVADLFGTIAAARIYGQIFTAWGCAGLLGPWSSGWLFDNRQSYLPSLIAAIVMSAASVVAVVYCYRLFATEKAATR
jgi:OFA family oxalate/formate antiporter-like MFS transporter